jgi:hypothetical protein
MKTERWFQFGLLALLWAPCLLADDFDVTTQTVGRIPVRVDATATPMFDWFDGWIIGLLDG